MEKGINLQIEEYKANLLKTINEAKMPPTVTTLLLQNILNDIAFATQQQIIKEKQDYDKSLESDKESK